MAVYSEKKLEFSSTCHRVPELCTYIWERNERNAHFSFWWRNRQWQMQKILGLAEGGGVREGRTTAGPNCHGAILQLWATLFALSFLLFCLFCFQDFGPRTSPAKCMCQRSSGWPWRRAKPMAWDWNWMIIDGPSNLSHSMILCACSI